MKLIGGLFTALLLASSGMSYAQNGSFNNAPSIDCSIIRNAVAAAAAKADAERIAKQEVERARLEAEEKARRDAVIEAERKAAQATADQIAKQEAERARREAEEKARRDAEIEAERKAEAERARREAEAEAARQWGLKVDEARTKGAEYAKKATFRWSVSETDNPMTDDKDYVVTSKQQNGTGVIAFVEGTCRKPGRVEFVATLQDALDPNTPLGLPDFANGYIAGNKRINDDPQFATRFSMQKFRNSLLISTLTSLAADEAIETTWRVLADIDTARGRMIIQIPTFDANVQKLLVACGRQFENAKNRRGLLDAPRVQ
jgi:hypothetical protein